MLPHPLYSSELASSNYHIFRSMQKCLNGKIFQNADNIKSHLIQFLASKDQKFYELGIMTLPERLPKVMVKNGHHLIEQSYIFTQKL